MQALDLSSETTFRTARSGGKGGQHVNKVETMVEALWLVRESKLFSEEDKARIANKLANKINKEGYLQVRSSERRTQLENKSIVQQKLQELTAKALIRPKPRKKIKPPKEAVEARLENKKKAAFKKQMRRKDW